MLGQRHNQKVLKEEENRPETRKPEVSAQAKSTQKVFPCLQESFGPFGPDIPKRSRKKGFPLGWSGCLAEGRLGLPGQVWELRFLLSFPSFPRENRSSRNVWGKRLEVPDILLPDIRGFLTQGLSAPGSTKVEKKVEKRLK